MNQYEKYQQGEVRGRNDNNDEMKEKNHRNLVEIESKYIYFTSLCKSFHNDATEFGKCAAATNNNLNLHQQIHSDVCRFACTHPT